MRILIFEPLLIGHHLEYLHHLYLGAVNKTNDTFVIAVPKKEWEEKKKNYIWPNSDNIEWLYLNDDECKYANQGNLIAQSLRLSRFIRRIAIHENVQSVFLIKLASVIPFLPLILPHNISISGIIYKIYLRSNRTGIRKWLDVMRYKIMAHHCNMGKVFILNDPHSTEKLNRLYFTDRFVTLADPVPDIEALKLTDLRKDFGITKDSYVFLHFGAMEERKGTLQILEAVSLISENKLKNMHFIFAGCVGDGIKEQFYSSVNKLKSRGVNIIVIDKFCSYETINSLCMTSDCILIPYLFTDLSSGALGYASVHKKPVIGPASGLIGELIHDNNMGTTLNNITPMTLSQAIAEFRKHAISCKYAQMNSTESFINSFIGSYTTK